MFVTELFSGKIRKYRYYILDGDWIEAGFDNSPDPRAIRFKYGQIGSQHIGENIPHLHLKDKSELSLTENIDFTTFVEWMKTNLPV